MDAAIWTLVAGVLTISGLTLGLCYQSNAALGVRIDTQGRELRSELRDGLGSLGEKIDRETSRLEARIDAQTARIDAQTARIDAQTTRVDALVQETAGLSSRVSRLETRTP